MEHLALYRKWRPQNFHTIIGQDDNVRVLKNAVVQGRTVHAYLFCGTRGTGKTSTARILAKALNCEHPVDGEPCNECENCRAITEGSFMDVIEIDAASNRGIDEARDLLEKVHFVPVKGKYKVYIIDEAHMLTTEAFNALLKTFEEPPAHVVFILATTEARKIPMTILSRCQRYDFKSINEKTLIEALTAIAKAENVAVEEDAIALLAEKARGSMRDALSLMDQAMGSEKVMTADELNRLTGSVPYDFWPDFFRGIRENDLPAVFAAMDEIDAEGKDLRQFFRDFRDFAGDLISGAVLKQETRYHQVLKECADLFTPHQILEMITVCGESEIVFRYNRDGKAVCRFLMARIMKALYPGVVAVSSEAPPARKSEPEPIPPKPVTAKPRKATEDFIFPNETIEKPSERKTAKQPTAKTKDEEPVSALDYPDFDLDNLIPPPEEEPFSPEEMSFPSEIKERKTTEKPDPDLIPPWETVPEPEVEELHTEVPSKPTEESKKPPKKDEVSASTEDIPASVEESKPVSTDPDEQTEILWAKLLKAVKEQGGSTFTWLSHGILKEITETEMVVSYGDKDGLFLGKVKEPMHTDVIEKELSNICGRSMRLQAVSAAEKDIQEMSLF